MAWLAVALKSAAADADRAAAAARRAELASVITAAPAAKPPRRSGTPARGLARKGPRSGHSTAVTALSS